MNLLSNAQRYYERPSTVMYCRWMEGVHQPLLGFPDDTGRVARLYRNMSFRPLLGFKAFGKNGVLDISIGLIS